MTSVKKIKVALLALVAALVIAIPTSAFAGTITITSQTTGDVYKAYQVFDGDVDTANTVLSNPVWGVNVDTEKAGFLDAVQGVLGDDVEDAAGAVKALSGADAAKTKAFADAIAPFLKETPAPVAFTETPAGSKSYVSAELDPGYWLVQQPTAGKTNAGDEVVTGSKTNFIAYFVGNTGHNVPVVAKASIPTVEKGVIEDSAEDAAVAGGTSKADYEKALANYKKTADYDEEQGIPYYIAGTLPTSYDNYKFYYYKFNDHMSNGLQYVDGSAKVYIYNNGVQGADVTNKFTIGWENQILSVEIADLKTVVPTYDANVKIVVLYNAKLTGDAVVYGDKGNPNDVYLEFSNNPNQDKGGEPEKGETPKEYAVVFVYELDNTKIDANEKTKLLSGAEFVLKNTTENSEFNGKYAKIANGKLCDWVELAKPEDAAADNKLISSAADENKGRFDLKGLDAGTYQLIEIKAPDGYSIGGPFNFTIAATLPADSTVAIDGGNLQALSITNDSGNTAGNKADGTVAQTIGNDKGSTLPSTGGIGTTIFTIVGIALIVAAAAIMVIRRRNAAAIQ